MKHSLIILALLATAGCSSVKLTAEQQEVCDKEGCFVVTKPALEKAAKEAYRRGYTDGVEERESWL